MKIIFNGRNWGDWELKQLPRLAARLGVTVEELTEASQEQERAETEAKAKALKAKADAEALDAKIGSPRKIQSVTASASFVALMVGLAIVKNSQETETGAAIAQTIEGIFPNEGGNATAKLLEILEAYEAGEAQAPVHAFGVEKSMSEMVQCGQEAFAFIAAAAAAKTAEPAPEAQADGNPVTGS